MYRIPKPYVFQEYNSCKKLDEIPIEQMASTINKGELPKQQTYQLTSRKTNSKAKSPNFHEF